MRLKGLLITLVIVLSAVFAVANWQVLFAPVPISYLFGTAELPLGAWLLAAAVGLALLFFLVSLFDRAGQLRQITQLERQLQVLDARLEKRRLEELEAVERALLGRIDALSERLEQGSGRLEANLREDLTAFEDRNGRRLAELEERLVLIRNELAADIAASEEILRRHVDREGEEEA